MAIELGESVGVYLDPWQQFCVRMILSEAANGNWAAFEAAVLVARQNGKGEILLVVELAGLFIFGERLILHSAHEFKTAAEAFLRIKAVIDGSDDLRRRVKQVWTSHGSEGIELLTGQRLRFVARSRSSGRGFTADRTILDEAQELPVAAMGALLPTLSARPNPQVIYTFTVPAPENDSEHIESVRARALEGGDPGLAYMGWSFDVTPDEAAAIDLDDRGVWAEANPAAGYRVTEEAIARERRSLSDEVFGRERLSIWPTKAGAVLFDEETWEALFVGRDHRPDPVAFSVTVSPDRKWSTIGLAGRRRDGSTLLQVVQSGKGTAWVVDRIAELQREHDPVAVVVDPSGPEGSLIPLLDQAGVRVMNAGPQAYGQACGMLADGIDAATVRHSGQPVLTIAVTSARKRRQGDVWVMTDDGLTDVTPAKAVALAMWALAKAGSGKKRRSGNVW